jgi:hypothetical protein
MAADSTRASRSTGMSAATEPSSRAVSTSPRKSNRSVTGRRRSRGASGGRRSIDRSSCAKRFSQAISSESRWPSVQISAVFAPFLSMIALVASVVPCSTSETRDGATPAASSTASAAAMKPSAGSEGVVSTLAPVWAPPCSSTASVKVPPMSMARRV